MPTPDVTYLAATNDQVDIYNARLLAKHLGTLWCFTAKDSGAQKVLDGNTACRKKLYLKVGVPVIVTRNITNTIVNGTQGVVLAIDRVNSIPTVKLQTLEGVTYDIRPVDFSMLCKGVLHIRHQLPLKLSWALTVHRAQGKTLAKVHVDCSQMFSSCHLSVALSRVSSISDVSLTNFNAANIAPAPTDLLTFVDTGMLPTEVSSLIVNIICILNFL